MNDEKVGLKLNIHYKVYFCLKQPLSNHLQSTSLTDIHITVLYSPPAFEVLILAQSFWFLWNQD